MLRTEQKAQQIFDENHVKIVSILEQTNERVDVITNYHKVQKEMFDRLTASNEAAVTLHEEVRDIFKTESQTFFE